MKILTASVIFILSGTAAHATAAIPELKEGWNTWEIQTPAHTPNWCCFESYSGQSSVCNLDRSQINFGTNDDARRSRTTEQMRIYALIQQGELKRLRIFGADCPVQAQTAITPVPNLSVQQSLDWLSHLSVSNSMREQQLLPALAMHNGGAPLLMNYALHDANSTVREQGWFWLAQINAAGIEQQALSVLQDAAKERSSSVRRQIVFALSQLQAPRAAAALMQVIEQQNVALATRKEALFWLGQIDDAAGVQYLDQVLSAGGH
jgi:HEAT repeats